MELTKALEALNLSKNEAKVYVGLLPLGLTTAGPIVSAVKLHRQLVYQALETLAQKNLVSFVIKNNRKHFQATSPKELVRLAKQQTVAAEAILPVLMQLKATAGDQIEVRTLYGASGFYDNLVDITESAARTDKTIRIIGGANDRSFYETLGDRYADYVALQKKFAVKKFLIAPESAATEFKQKFAYEPGNILRTMAEGLTAPIYTRITPEMVSIEIYLREPIVVQIINRALAAGYIEHFQLLWKQASAPTAR